MNAPVNPNELELQTVEFKLDGSAEQALAQIDSTGYLIPWQAMARDSGRRLVKVGVEFDKASRSIGRWLAG